MKKIYSLLVVLVLALLLCSCGATKVDQGYEAAKINTLGSGKGEIEVVGQGWHFFNSFKFDLIKNPIFAQEYVWTKNPEEGSRNDESITFQSANSLAFTADVGISFSIVEGASGLLYKKYHKSIKALVDTNLRNSVRDAFNRLASERDAETIYGKGKADFIAAVHADVQKFWEGYLTIHKIYLIGKLEPPTQVKLAIAKKIEATQKAQQRRNEVAEAEAAADKQIAEAKGKAESRKLAADANAYEIERNAEAKAKAIKLVNKQLEKSPLYIEFIKAQNWDGKLPTYMMGQSVPMINLK